MTKIKEIKDFNEMPEVLGKTRSTDFTRETGCKKEPGLDKTKQKIRAAILINSVDNIALYC